MCGCGCGASGLDANIVERDADGRTLLSTSTMCSSKLGMYLFHSSIECPPPYDIVHPIPISSILSARDRTGDRYLNTIPRSAREENHTTGCAYSLYIHFVIEMTDGTIWCDASWLRDLVDHDVPACERVSDALLLLTRCEKAHLAMSKNLGAHSSTATSSGPPAAMPPGVAGNAPCVTVRASAEPGNHSGARHACNPNVLRKTAADARTALLPGTHSPTVGAFPALCVKATIKIAR